MVYSDKMINYYVNIQKQIEKNSVRLKRKPVFMPINISIPEILLSDLKFQLSKKYF